jgi:hypothetical protein
MLAAVLIACGGSSSQSTVAQSSWNPVGPPNEYGWVKPAETLRISVYGGEGNMQTFLEDAKGGKAYYDKWLLDNMNIVMDWQIYANPMDERLNLMLADGSYPGVIVGMTDEMANRFASQGRAVDLTPYLHLIPNLTRRVGDYLNMLKTDDGKLYKLPNGWGDNVNVAGFDFGIRHDYWQELGLTDIYRTPEEYYQTLKAVLANHPTSPSGEKTYAITATNGSGDQGVAMLRAMLAAYGFTGDNYLHMPNGSFQYWLRTPQGREISLWFNKLWREGMIDPDYLSTTYEDYISKQSTHRVIGNLGTWWYAWVGGHEIWSVEDPNYTIGQRFMNVSIHGPGLTLDDTRLLTSNFLGNYRVIITDKCTQIEAVLAYINWCASELGNMIAGWGPPATTNNWHIDNNGMWIINDQILNVDQKNLYFHDTKERHGGNIYTIGACAGWLRSDGRSVFDKIDPRVDRVSIFDYWPVNPVDGSFSDEGVKISWGFYYAPPFDTILYTTSFDPEARVTMTRQSILESLPTWWANIMTASTEAACIQAFNNALAAAERLGLADLEAFYAESYRTTAARMSGR